MKKVVWHYTKLIQKISSPQSKCNLAEYFPKNFLDSCICTLLISLALVQAGTGDIPVLRLARYLQRKIGCVTQTTTSNFYGLEMCVSMAIGILFLGGGRYSLSNDDRSIAVILASVFPKWPTNASDNRYVGERRNLFSGCWFFKGLKLFNYAFIFYCKIPPASTKTFIYSRCST